MNIPRDQQELLKKLPLPTWMNLHPVGIEWEHPYLIFLAEHGIISKTQEDENKTTALLRQIVDEELNLIMNRSIAIER